mmetsp:Transcript_21624/g.28485  ORF Transcript_21624/g.28485 Transcript_21624/m.28485 type:complete len:400 (-) Transcript_21624:68-1267(-)
MYSSPTSLRIGIYGCGAIGMYIGTVLQKHSNCSVVYLVRSNRLKESIEQDAMESVNIVPMREDHFSIPLSELDISTDPCRMKNCDIILVAVKSMDTEAVGTKLSSILPTDSDAIIISLQNGIKNASTLQALLPNRRVLAGVVAFNVVKVNSTFTQNTSGSLHIEKSPPSVNHGAAFTRTHLENLFVSILSSTVPAIPKIHHDPSIKQTQYGKLLLNLVNAPIALSGKPTKEFILNPYYRLVSAECISEALLVFHAAGIKPSRNATRLPPLLLPHLFRLPNRWYTLLVRGIMKIDPKSKPSMLQDLESDQYQTEIDFLQGEIVAIGKKYKVSTPVNEMIHKEMSKVCKRRNGSPNLDANELLLRAGVTKTISMWYEILPLMVVGSLLGIATVGGVKLATM